MVIFTEYCSSYWEQGEYKVNYSPRKSKYPPSHLFIRYPPSPPSPILLMVWNFKFYEVENIWNQFLSMKSFQNSLLQINWRGTWKSKRIFPPFRVIPPFSHFSCHPPPSHTIRVIRVNLIYKSHLLIHLFPLKFC